MNEPTIFRVHLTDGSSHWGLQKPWHRVEFGQSVSMLDSGCFGWRYHDQSLEDVLRDWFDGFDRVEIFKLTPC